MHEVLVACRESLVNGLGFLEGEYSRTIHAELFVGINMVLRSRPLFLTVIVLMACLGYLECYKGALDYG